MKLVHVFLLREMSRPTQAEAERIWLHSKLGLSFITAGMGYAQGEQTLRLEAATPAAAKGILPLQDLMPFYIRSEAPRYVEDATKFQIELESGVDAQTNEHFCLAAVYEVT